MTMPKKVLFPSFSASARVDAVFTDAGFEVMTGIDADEMGFGRSAPSRAGIRRAAVERAMHEKLPAAHALQAVGVGGHLPVTAEVLDRAPLLEVVFIGAAGFDKIDVAAATDRGIAVVNGPGGNAAGVAEHALGLMLTLTRRIAHTDRYAHRELRELSRSEVLATKPGLGVLYGKTVGLVGFGFIGRHLAQRCQAMGMDVLAYDPYFDSIEAERLGVRLVSDLDVVLRTADFVSIHTPLTSATRKLISTRELELMKPTAYLINTSRGATVDTDALVKALKEQSIAGAGLDVAEPEPLPDGHPLFSLPSVVLTPHIGGVSPELIEASALTAARLAVEILHGRRPPHLVNPEVWPEHIKRFGSAESSSGTDRT
ncbi:NAD(P)-dependent oxidoreductase [Streptomyces sp. NPDC008092]|uniref:NAD(P)-dependent oxidoreductase n=1 Tax=Streptomyces sp. NPDC008092 TaxID=3364808 RepID=UPI0036E37066